MKLKSLTPWVCSGVIALSGLACSDLQSNKSRNTVIDTNALSESSDSIEQVAETLALAGEQLMSPISFMYADFIFDLALQKDGSNQRAQFYKALLKPIMQQKGIIKRIQPVVRTLDTERQQEFNEAVAKFPESALKTFLLDGAEDITNEADLLSFIDGHTQAWEEIRLFMKNNKDMNLDINVMTIPGVEAALERAARECAASQVNDGVFSISENCDYLKALKINVSRADIEVIQHMAAGMQIYLTAGTSYSLDGVRDFIEANKDQTLTAQQVINHFANNTTAGKLRHNGLTKISEMGTDIVSGVRWAMSIQDQLCPNGKYGSQNARSKSLIPVEFCIDAQDSEGNTTESKIAQVEQILAGGLLSINYLDRISGEEKTTEIQPMALLNQPIADLRDVIPTAAENYNQCGDLSSLVDKTLGGLFPNNDAEQVLMDSGVLKDDNCQ
jgi:hypothetical protein